ncbi:2-polyprenyl-6-methoxyphenol hydroxylase [Nocardia seriolae]|uniref:2-polyprenyl-6-methoxyphenol hydroxylase n=1 Tax=Nocardia seriolae TaxID=37332 RepID=A0ABC9YR23_9NOCA|nr:2-polyprenyl-6-methoxyphenol hydroxylase [Nocardia seriolae]GAP27882.1 2-polyprenyl-6-methoxyphenol hydroxylase [Nocardia seriolae]GEM23509.1 FAD-dependent oxidoreductase [Nocardia seriolae NBRC 15557]
MVAHEEFEVLIVGGGPVGLTARALLDRWGVRTLLVERRRELSPFPRSRLVNVRSMEIFRQLGLAETVRKRAFGPEFGRVRFRETLSDSDFGTEAMVGVRAPIPESPEIGVLTSQDRLEPTLLAAADAPLRFGVDLVDLAEDDDGVTATLVDRDTTAESRVRARYVLAADGANSTVRQRLGIATTGPGALGESTTVVFDADLGRWCADQPAGVYFTTNGSFLPLYPEGGWAWFGPASRGGEVDWSARVTDALGPDIRVAVEVVRVQRWVMNAFVAERLRHGRIFLAGDAAHTVPILGGLGMNAGLADVHNLCWNLAGALRGWAAPELLETYETERLPVAHRTLRQAVTNAERVRAAQLARRAQRAAGDTGGAVELPWSERYFDQIGLILGVSYDSAAVRPDGSPPPPDDAAAYLPSGRPGARLPHCWLAPGRSSLDALGEWFTVLTPDPGGWEKRIGTTLPLRFESLPEGHAELYGIDPDGALLVRPDGHIGARLPQAPDGPVNL